MTANNVRFGKHVKVAKKTKVYTSVADMCKDQVSASTINHNRICEQQRSRRNKLTVKNDDMKDRKNKVRERLLKKLAAKKAQK